MPTHRATTLKRRPSLPNNPSTHSHRNPSIAHSISTVLSHLPINILDINLLRALHRLPKTPILDIRRPKLARLSPHHTQRITTPRTPDRFVCPGSRQLFRLRCPVSPTLIRGRRHLPHIKEITFTELTRQAIRLTSSLRRLALHQGLHLQHMAHRGLTRWTDTLRNGPYHPSQTSSQTILTVAGVRGRTPASTGTTSSK